MIHTCRTPGCSSTFRTHTELVRHEKVHDAGRAVCPFKSTACAFTTFDKEDMRNHVKTQHPNLKTHQCPESSCPYMTGNTASLSRHCQARHRYELPRKSLKTAPKASPSKARKKSAPSKNAHGSVSQMGVASSSSEAQAVIPLTEYGFIGYDSFLNPHAYFPDPILYPAPPEPGSTDMPYINDDDTTADYVPARPGICENWQSLYIKPPVGCERRSSQSLYFYTGA